MHHPKSLRSKCIRFAMIPAALVCAILSGCADQQPTESRVGPVARDVDVPFNKFFVAWSESFTSSPIQSQVFAVDARQNRQFSPFAVNEGVLAFARANPGRTYINGDEIDQYCVPAEDYAVMYHDFVVAIRGADPTARLSPSGFAEPNYHCCPLPDDVPTPCWESKHSIGYAEVFYNAYTQRYGSPPPVDEWRFHDFGVAMRAGDVDDWWSRVERAVNWSVAHGANMVLGSWGFISWRDPAFPIQETIKQAMGRIMNEPRIVEAVYWSREPMIYATHYLQNGDGSLTAVGQTFVNPLTDVPASVTTAGSSDGGAKLQWSNTTEAWSTEAEFWVQAKGSGSFVYNNTERLSGAGATETSMNVFRPGDSVRGRVRYYNDYGQAAWSSFSDPVVISGEQASKGTGSRKTPRFCFLPLGSC
jgi:hypothetical protein